MVEVKLLSKGIAHSRIAANYQAVVQSVLMKSSTTERSDVLNIERVSVLIATVKKFI